MELSNLLQTLINEKGSDLFLSVGIQPCLKVNGKVHRLGEEILNEDQVLDMIKHTMTEDRLRSYFKYRDANFAISIPNLGRFRVSAFWQQDLPGCSIRRINTIIPTCDELFLPLSVKQLAMAKRGLVLFVGATGAGKSTTQAAMVGYRNRHATDHIVITSYSIHYTKLYESQILFFHPA